jgi:RNA polymerase sigma-70 factor (ECF subfamily)
MKATDNARVAWQRFVETFEPLRPELYRYCRFLTRNAWDAEDLVQDALARGLVTLGCLFQDVENPRAWLFRVASNLWIDRQRRVRDELRRDVEARSASSDRLSLEGQDAAATLIGRLSPQERAALVLKDVFDFTLDETAVILTTTPGAIKAALHRGRRKVADPEVASSPVPSAVIDAFCDAFNARDLDRLVALLLDTATAEVVGIATEYGPGKMKQSDTGSLYHSLFSPLSHAVAAEYLSGYRGGPARAERREHRGEPILVSWYDHDEGPAVRDVIRITEEEGRVTSVKFYFFCPDVIAEIAGEIDLPWRSNGYRYWPKASASE